MRAGRAGGGEPGERVTEADAGARRNPERAGGGGERRRAVSPRPQIPPTGSTRFFPPLSFPAKGGPWG